MYKVVNIYEHEFMVYLADHKRIFNDRIHVLLQPMEEIKITDDQYCKEIGVMEKRGKLYVEYIQDQPIRKMESEKKAKKTFSPEYSFIESTESVKSER